ncbi:hypothetical protein ACFWVC_28960, partial [Streptomyces sp. NPDC058691]|uniref:hypothetical protein n=1 Tax=Streptomyces sp. NPDC058691 TaxID=3346601 RepID=UPI00365EF2D9
RHAAPARTGANNPGDSWQHVESRPSAGRTRASTLSCGAGSASSDAGSTAPTCCTNKYRAGRAGGGLAHQLDTARTTPPTFDPVLAGSAVISDDVDSARDLRMYAGALATDFGRDRREVLARISRCEWAHDEDAWAAWVNDTPLTDRLEPVTWRSVALQLSAARIYE